MSISVAMLTFSAATRAARCVVGSWVHGNLILRRTIVLQCPGSPLNNKLCPPCGDLAFKSAALAVFSSQRSPLSTAQTLSESAKASATASSEAAGEGDDKPKYKPLTKWQKWGYIFFGVNMLTIVIGRHVTDTEPLYYKFRQGRQLAFSYCTYN